MADFASFTSSPSSDAGTINTSTSWAASNVSIIGSEIREFDVNGW
jgi:hypothetical protein